MHPSSGCRTQSSGLPTCLTSLHLAKGLARSAGGRSVPSARSASCIVEPLTAITSAPSVAGMARLTLAWNEFGETLSIASQRIDISEVGKVGLRDTTAPARAASTHPMATGTGRARWRGNANWSRQLRGTTAATPCQTRRANRTPEALLPSHSDAIPIRAGMLITTPVRAQEASTGHAASQCGGIPRDPARQTRKCRKMPLRPHEPPMGGGSGGPGRLR